MSVGRQLVIAFVATVALTGVLSIVSSGRVVIRTLRGIQQDRLNEEKERLDIFLQQRSEQVFHKAVSVAEDPSVQSLVRRWDEPNLAQRLDLLRRALNLDVLVVVDRKRRFVASILDDLPLTDKPHDPIFSEAMQGKNLDRIMPTNLGFEMRAVVPVGKPPTAALLAGLSLSQSFVEEQKMLFGMDVAVLYEGEVLAHTLPFELKHFPSRTIFQVKELGGDEAHLVEAEVEGNAYFTVIKPIYIEERGTRQGFLVLFLSKAELVAASRHTLRQMGLVALVAVLLATAVGVVVARRLTTPILALAGSAQKIARGEQVKVPLIPKRDEIGVLSRAFIQMTENLRDIIEDQRQQIHRILDHVRDAGQGDLTRAIGSGREDAFGQLAAGFDQMIASLRELVTSIRDVAGTVEGQSQGLLVMSHEQTQRMKELSRQMMEIVGATEENLASLRTTSDQTEKLAQFALEMERVSSDGQRAVEQAQAAMSGIRQTAQLTEKRMKHLSDLSQEIGKVVLTIQDVADQIHLLSLNAAIEAARAGELGRGFSVVADEVRKLAEGTHRDAEQIASIVRMIQSETSATTMAMEQELKQVEAGMTTIENTGTVLQSLIAAIAQCAHLSRTIQVATEEGKGGAERVANQTASMQRVIREVEEAAGRLREQAESLKEASAELKTSSGRFQV